uniref:DUF418 domain-containing protein n=1 Tax=Macrostomum lignano TaxID=282301 RepID=A0A1I8JPL6_9PLAT
MVHDAAVRLRRCSNGILRSPWRRRQTRRAWWFSLRPTFCAQSYKAGAWQLYLVVQTTVTILLTLWRGRSAIAVWLP